MGLCEPTRIGRTARYDLAALPQMGHQGGQVRLRAGRFADVDEMDARRCEEMRRKPTDGRHSRRIPPHRLLAHLSEPAHTGRRTGQRGDARRDEQPDPTFHPLCSGTGRLYDQLLLPQFRRL